jgi:hypothetical protein
MILGSLLIAAVETFIIYAVVRYFIFDSAEFDERTDGVVYGTAAGLGYATALNLSFILTSGVSALGGSEVYMAEVALAYAAFGGLIGYFLGHAKMQRDPIWWLPLGFMLTVLLNGLFFILRGQLETGSVTEASVATSLPSVLGLVLSGILAIIVTAVVAFLVNRDVTMNTRGQAASAEDPTKGDRQANLAVIATFAVLLLIGILGWNSAVYGATAFNTNGISGAYPSYFGNATTDQEVLRVADRVGTGAEFALATKDLTGGKDLKTVTSLLAAERGSGSLIYKVLDSHKTSINGKDAQVQQFAYVDSGGFTGALPRVIQGTDYIFTQGDRAIIVTMLATPDTVGEVEPLFMNFVNSLKF